MSPIINNTTSISNSSIAKIIISVITIEAITKMNRTSMLPRIEIRERLIKGIIIEITIVLRFLKVFSF